MKAGRPQPTPEDRPAPAGPIRLHHEPDEDVTGPAVVRWLIDGYPAEVLIWTAEQWGSMKNPPPDAQPYPSGLRALLRVV